MTIKIDQAISAYIKMRDAITEKQREGKEYAASLKDKMSKLELFIFAKMDELGVDSFKSSGSTAFKTTKDSVTISDKEEFKTFLAKTLLMSLQGYHYQSMEGDWQPDGEADLKEHIAKLLNSGAFDLLTVAANKNNCKDYMTTNDGLMPPGVDYRKEIVIQIRKGK